MTPAKKQPDPFQFVTEKGQEMADPTKNLNAPNEINNPTPSHTEGGKVKQGPNEGGTSKDPAGHKDPIGNVIDKTDPQSLRSPSQEEADAAKSKVIDKEETKDGVVTLTSALDQASLDRHLKSAGTIPKVVNETMALTGQTGYINLTQDGKLNSDKSVREDVPLEEQFAELNKITGPNPTPLRDGNESTKSANAITGAGLMSIDRNTTFMAEDINKILEKVDKEGSLSQDDKDKLRQMSENLRTTGTF